MYPKTRPPTPWKTPDGKEPKDLNEKVTNLIERLNYVGLAADAELIALLDYDRQYAWEKYDDACS